MTRRIFHIDLDAFFVAVERTLDPSLGGRPVVVGGEPGGRGVVACASYEARAYGLHAGMSLKQAYRLCPQAVYLPGRYTRYQEVSQRFQELLREYSPFLEPLGLDEAHLDMTGFEELFGPLFRVARELKERVRRELGVVASVGIAGSRETAKVAANLGKPDGLVEVPPGEDAAFLAPLPVGKLPGVGPKTEAVLKRVGIEQVEELAATPPVVLRRWFGAAGDLLHRWANGQDHAWVTPDAQVKSISRETTFAQDVVDGPLLRGMLRYLSERVGAQLRREGKAARCVTLRLRYADFTTISRSRTLRRPSQEDGTIYGEAVAALERAWKERRDRVRLIGVGVGELVAVAPQLSLLDMGEERGRQLCAAVDTIRQRYGFNAIQYGRTFALGDVFPSDERGYVLKTPSLSR